MSAWGRREAPYKAARREEGTMRTLLFWVGAFALGFTVGTAQKRMKRTKNVA